MNIGKTFDKFSLLHKHKAQTFVKPKLNPVNYTYQKIDHMSFWTNNSLHAANFYINNFGFELKAFKNSYSHHNTPTNEYLVQNGGVMLLLASPNQPNLKTFENFLSLHGDTLRAVSIQVSSLKDFKQRVRDQGISIYEEFEDCHKKSVSLLMFGNTVFNFFELKQGHYFSDLVPYDGQSDFHVSKINDFLPKPLYKQIDHIGFPQNEGQREEVLQLFHKLGFHDFWAVDDKVIYSETSTLKSTVITDFNENVKFPIFEPKKLKKKSQIQEFLENNGGPGTQHIALEVDDILSVVSSLTKRGIQFLSFPDSYYEMVEDKMKEHKVHLKVDIESIKKHKILIDFDENGFLLQIFTKPILDRPTLFMEFIQRFNNKGFGEGNFQ